MGKELILSSDSILQEFGGVIGTDIQGGGSFYPNIVILQSDKTFSQFSDGDTLTLKSMGKLFIRSKAGNHSSDLVETISGTLIKEQHGCEYWVDGRLVYSENRYITAEEKEDLKKQYGGNEDRGEKPTNMIKMIIKLDNPITLVNGEKYEYAVYTVKGASFGSHGEMKEQQKQLLVNAGTEVPVGKMPVTFWHLDISSTLIDDKVKKNKYYVAKFLVKLNDIETAKSFKKDLVDADKINLFDMMGRKEDVRPNDLVEDGTIIDPNDLPF